MKLSADPQITHAFLPLPARVRTVVFTDFDETYLAHAATPARRAAREELDRFLHEAALRRGVLFGWVTGSSVESALARARQHGATVLPHFVAGALGTELVHFTDGQARPDPGWERRIAESGYSTAAVDRAVRALAGRGVALDPQSNRGATSLVRSYYHRTRGPAADARAAELIRAAARESAAAVNLSRCNPRAGDPEDCYDVDFLPTVCGKRQVVQYLCDRHGIDPATAYAFGDSGNDLDMLGAVGHPVLVANCTEEARSSGHPVSAHQYAAALLHTLRESLDDTSTERNHP